MKVAYVSAYNSNDINNWSGLGYYMYKCIADQGVEVILINSEVRPGKWLRIRANFTRLFFGKRYEIARNPGFLKKMAAKACQQLKEIKFDLVLSPGSLPVAYLNTDKPIVFWTDATFDCLVGFYPEWNNLSKRSLRDGHEAEQLAINRASMIFYTSDWARENAITHYKAPPAKVKQIPNGPNLESHLTEEDIEAIICRRQKNEQIKLLFVGLDWNRKGGDQAVETVTRLREMGQDAVLTIVGSYNAPASLPAYVVLHPFVDKTLPDGVDKLNELYNEANFFILPTKAECFAVVFAEAGSHGLPVITTNVGGCSSAIKNGYNGFCLEVVNFSAEAAEKISHLAASPDLYRQYSLNAFQNYRKDLNWDVVGKRVVKAMKELMNQKSLLLLGLYQVVFGMFALAGGCL